MPYVYQAGVFTSIAINLGLADKQFQDELLLLAGTAASYTKTTRDLIVDSLDNSSTDTNTDSTLTLSQALRSAEISLPSTIDPVYSGTLGALNSYFSAVVGESFRDYFNSKTTDRTINFVQTTPASTGTGFSSFRDIYRRTYNSELIYKLHERNTAETFSGTSGTYDNAGALLEVRKYGAANNNGTISLSCVRASDGGSDAIVLSYTAGILVTYTNAANLTTLDRRYLYVSGIAITGMSGSGASFEVWTR